MSIDLKRCWNTKNPLYIEYHDKEWGVPLHDDKKLFEFLVLDGFQAGLSWWIVLQKRDSFRQAFNDFDPEKVSHYSAKDIERLMTNQNLIRNRAKILAAVNNANRFIDTQKEFGTFNAFIWKFVHGKTIRNFFRSLADLPAETEESRAMSQELRRRGFKFVGPTICYAFMQAAGLVNDHLVDCFRYYQIKNMCGK